MRGAVPYYSDYVCFFYTFDRLERSKADEFLAYIIRAKRRKRKLSESRRKLRENPVENREKDNLLKMFFLLLAKEKVVKGRKTPLSPTYAKCAGFQFYRDGDFLK